MRQYARPVSAPAASAGWSTPARYRFVLATLRLSLTSVIGSLVGTSAIGALAVAAAWSSLSASAGLFLPGSPRSGAVHAVQPSAGPTNRSTRPLSLPLVIRVARVPNLARLAAVSWAERPLARIR